MVGRKRLPIENGFKDLGKDGKRYRVQCTTCGASFEAFRGKNHICSAVDEENQILYEKHLANNSCTLCGQSFSNIGNAKKHLRLRRCRNLPTKPVPLPTTPLVEEPTEVSGAISDEFIEDLTAQIIPVASEINAFVETELLADQLVAASEMIDSVALQPPPPLIEEVKHCNHTTEATSSASAEAEQIIDNNFDDSANIIECKAALLRNKEDPLASESIKGDDEIVNVNTYKQKRMLLSHQLTAAFEMTDGVALHPPPPLFEEVKHCNNTTEATPSATSVGASARAEQIIVNNFDESANIKEFKAALISNGDPLTSESIKGNDDDDEIVYINTYKQRDMLSYQLRAVSSMIDSVDLRAVQKIQKPTIYRPVYMDGPNIAYE